MTAREKGYRERGGMGRRQAMVNYAVLWGIISFADDKVHGRRLVYKLERVE